MATLDRVARMQAPHWRVLATRESRMKSLLRVAGDRLRSCRSGAAHAEEAGATTSGTSIMATIRRRRLRVVDKAEVEADEAYWPFLMQCSFDEPWTMTVADVDAKALGADDRRRRRRSISLHRRRQADAARLGGDFPDLRFSQMDGEWEYSVELGSRRARPASARRRRSRSTAPASTAASDRRPDGGVDRVQGGFARASRTRAETAPDALRTMRGDDAETPRRQQRA